MTIALVGELALWVALLLTAWGTVVSSAAVPLGRADLALSGRRAGHAAALFVFLALLALFASFLRLDFGLRYVQAHGGVAATPGEVVVALWAGPGGALLVVAIALTALASPGRSPAAVADVSLVRAFVLLLASGVLLTVLAFAMPFERLTWPVADGLGLAPDRRHWTMLLLWPLWAAGTAMATVAAGAAAASVTTIPAESRWRTAHRWISAAWWMHGAVLLLAVWWSYHTTPAPDGWLLRAVDPVALVAWGALTAAVHLPGSRRRFHGRWRLALVILPLPLLLVGPLLRPEGSWDPLHALAHDTASVGWVVLIAAVLLACAFALVRFAPSESPSGHAAAAGVAPAVGGGTRGERPATASRTLGARLAHVGFILVVAGVLAGGMRRDNEMLLAPAESAVGSDALGREWRVVFQGISVEETRAPFGAPRSREILLPVAVGRLADAGDALIVPEVREYVDALGRPTSPQRPFPAIARGALFDVVVFPDSAIGEEAALTVSFVPVPGLLWLGGLAILIGGAISAQAALGARVNRAP